MKAVIQRVREASVEVSGKIVGAIGPGILVLLGVEKSDDRSDAAKLAKKICDLRIFEDDAGKMNRSVRETGGRILAVSQFTLAGNCAKGRRPSFDDAAAPERADELYRCFCEVVEQEGIPVERGIFRADMQVALVNDGPVTFILDSATKTADP